MRFLAFLLVLVVVSLDQWTKNMAEAYLLYNQPESILPVLDFTLRYNPGAAFSFLANQDGWQRYFLSILAAVVSLVLAFWILRLKSQERLLGIGLALVLGGALGNLYDRVALGHVVDFISFHWGDWYFPAFNVADSAISVGAVFLIFDSFMSKDNVTS
jgi:signal peptidase II